MLYIGRKAKSNQIIQRIDVSIEGRKASLAGAKHVQHILTQIVARIVKAQTICHIQTL